MGSFERKFGQRRLAAIGLRHFAVAVEVEWIGFGEIVQRTEYRV